MTWSKTVLAALATLSLLAGGPERALASETAITLDHGVAAILNRPANGTKAPAVLMLHGFGSSKDEVGNMYKREAAALAARGIASLRIDFQGFGKSDGDTGSTTVDGQLSDAENALAYLRTVADVDPQKIGILGFSMGGGIAILTATKHPTEVKSLATWSSVGDFHKDFLGALGQKPFDAAAKEGVVGLDLGWRTIVLKKAFFDSLDHFSVKDAIKTWPGPYLAIAGGDDFAAAYSQKYVDEIRGSPKEALVLPGQDHIYHVLSDDQKPADKVIDTTAQWFAKTL